MTVLGIEVGCIIIHHICVYILSSTSNLVTSLKSSGIQNMCKDGLDSLN